MRRFHMLYRPGAIGGRAPRGGFGRKACRWLHAVARLHVPNVRLQRGVFPQSFGQLLEFRKQGIREIALILENVKKASYAPLILTGEGEKIVPDLEKVAKVLQWRPPHRRVSKNM